MFAIGRPGAAAVVCAGRAGDVLCDAFLHGQVEDFAAGGDRESFAVGREAGAAQVVAAVFDGAAGVDVV